MKVSVNLACVCTGTEGTCKPLRRRSLDLIFDFKFANWLESYADTLELNVWTSSTVTKAIPDSSSKRWNVTVRRNGAERIFNVKHTIFATGFGGTIPNTPKIPGAVSLLACDKRMMPMYLCKGKVQGTDSTLSPIQASYRSRREEGCCSWRLYFRYAISSFYMT